MEELERWLDGLDKGTRASRETWERLVLGRAVQAGDEHVAKNAVPEGNGAPEENGALGGNGVSVLEADLQAKGRFLSRLEWGLRANMTSLYFRLLASWFTPGDPHRGSVRRALSLVKGLGGCTRRLRDLTVSELKALAKRKEIPPTFRDRERSALESWYRHLDGIRREALAVGECVELQGRELDETLSGGAATAIRIEAGSTGGAPVVRSLAVGLSLYVILTAIGLLGGRPEELPAASALVRGWWERRDPLTRETLASSGPLGIFHPSNRYYLLNPGFGLREWKGGRENGPPKDG